MNYQTLKQSNNPIVAAAQVELLEVRLAVENRESTPSYLLGKLSSIDRSLYQNKSGQSSSDLKKEFLSCYSQNPLAEIAKSLSTPQAFAVVSAAIKYVQNHRENVLNHNCSHSLYATPEIENSTLAKLHNQLSGLDMLHKFMKGQCGWREKLNEDSACRLKHNFVYASKWVNQFTLGAMFGNGLLDPKTQNFNRTRVLDEIHTLFEACANEIAESFCGDYSFKNRTSVKGAVFKNSGDSVGWKRLHPDDIKYSKCSNIYNPVCQAN